MKKFWKESAALAWTLAGTALVLITLSGDVKRTGIIISAAALLFHFAGVFTPEDKE